MAQVPYTPKLSLTVRDHKGRVIFMARPGEILHTEMHDGRTDIDISVGKGDWWFDEINLGLLVRHPQTVMSVTSPDEISDYKLSKNLRFAMAYGGWLPRRIRERHNKSYTGSYRDRTESGQFRETHLFDLEEQW